MSAGLILAVALLVVAAALTQLSVVENDITLSLVAIPVIIGAVLAGVSDHRSRG